MKNLILTSVISIALIGCKKKTSEAEIKVENNDSVVAIKTQPEVEKLPLKEKSIAEITDFLQKKNDTLYVTNFFATWCGPCVNEIPHFKNKIEELKGSPVKITFVSLDNKDIWNTEVPTFVDEHGIRNNTVLLDGNLIDQNFFKNNFKQWTGDAIPFTFMRKGDKTEEVLGMITAEDLDSKISSFKN